MGGPNCVGPTLVRACGHNATRRDTIEELDVPTHLVPWLQRLATTMRAIFVPNAQELFGELAGLHREGRSTGERRCGATSMLVDVKRSRVPVQWLLKVWCRMPGAHRCYSGDRTAGPGWTETGEWHLLPLGHKKWCTRLNEGRRLPPSLVQLSLGERKRFRSLKLMKGLPRPPHYTRHPTSVFKKIEGGVGGLSRV